MTNDLSAQFSRNRSPVLFPSRRQALLGVAANQEDEVDLATAYTLPITGQGVFALTTVADGPFRITLAIPGSNRAVVLKLEDGRATLLERPAHRLEKDIVLAEVSDSKGLPPVGVEPGQERTYWFSLDSRNYTLVYGKGYAIRQFAMLEYTFKDTPENPDDFWTSGISKIKLGGKLGTVLGHHVHRYPSTYPVPPVIGAFADVTMDDVAKGSCLVSSEMPEETQALYGTVAGPSFQLNTPDFPDFAEAINYSIDTPGCICYEKLAEKAREKTFSSDPRENYLRVTLGPNLGDSPGVPFVLELWPKQCFSPIHNHADAYAVIKVLHGTIWVQLFPEFSPTWPADAYKEYAFPQGGVTWLSPDCFQTHRLKNNGTETMTATIQCYRYPNNDDVHYEYFDYIGTDKQGKPVVEQFLPDSDFDFIPFKAAIKEEWERARTK